MTTPIILAVPVIALAVVLAAGVYLFVAARRARPQLRLRSQKIAALCAQRGLLASTEPDDFPLLGPIQPRWLANHFASPDRSLAVADFYRPAGKTVQLFSLLAFKVADLNLPYVAVTRRDLMSITLGGPPELQLESTQFTERFIVKAKDQRSATMLLDPGIMQLVLDCGDVSFDMNGDKVLAYINRAHEPAHPTAEPVELEMLFRFRDGFVSRLPDLLRNEYAATQ